MSESAPVPAAPAALESTRIAMRWRLKTLGFAALLLSFGVLGLYDFYVAYPKRGMADASYKLKNWLDAAQSAGTLAVSTLAVQDPPAALSELQPRVDELRRSSAGETATARAAAVQLAKQQWLDSLKRMWRLRADPILVDTTTRAADATASSSPGSPSAEITQTGPARDIYFDPRSGQGFWVAAGSSNANLGVPADAKNPLSPTQLLGELNQKWRSTTPPTPLSQLDMAFQWVFVIVGFPGGLWLLAVYLRGSTKLYRWNAGELRLHLPGGTTLVPADLKELDKTKWHKFYVTLITHAGQQHELDLYRYIPLEDWVVAMEKAAFPSDPPNAPTPTDNAVAASA